MTTAQDVLNLAISQLGTTEKPRGSNYSKYGAWYGINPGAWCAMFVSYCFYQAGIALNIESNKGFASCGTGRDWFQKHGQLVTNPHAGDIVFFEWENDNWPDHVGIVESVNSNGSINTIEGNSPGPDHTDEVTRHTRNRSLCKWFARPVYASIPVAKPIPVQTVRPVITFNLTDSELGNMQKHNFVMPLDSNGCGWKICDGTNATPVVDVSKVVSCEVQGGYPPTDGYWHGESHYQDRGGHPCVSVTNGPPNGSCNVFLVVAT